MTTPTPDREALLALAEEVANGDGLDNELDVRIEVALFEPGKGWASCRANAAGTKVIYTDVDGVQRTYWAEEWTGDRLGTSLEIGARALAGDRP